MKNDEIKNLSVEKLLEELDYCGCDTYYLDYRNIIISEIKSRLNKNEQLKQQLKNEKQLNVEIKKRLVEVEYDCEEFNHEYCDINCKGKGKN